MGTRGASFEKGLAAIGVALDDLGDTANAGFLGDDA
ncbi:MAG: hypothetical protein ACI8PZ_001852 [Myxococcota bacterium]